MIYVRFDAALVADSACMLLIIYKFVDVRDLLSFPTRRSSDLEQAGSTLNLFADRYVHLELLGIKLYASWFVSIQAAYSLMRSEEHTSELQSLTNLVCRLLLEKKKIHKDQLLVWHGIIKSYHAT